MQASSRTEPSRDAPLSETNRLEAFSDGVFAVAITLLVLDIHLPSPEPERAQLWAALTTLRPAFLSWLTSFFFVLVIWVNHHYLFNQIERTDRRMLWINGLLLFGICFIPFPTALAGRYFLATPGLFLLSLSMLIVSVAFSWMRWHAGFVSNLTHGHISLAARRGALRRSFIGPIAYGAAAVLSFAWPLGALLIQVVIPIWFAFGLARRPVSRESDPG